MRALSLDGGGFRGIIPAYWLRYLDDRLERPILEYFDILAGTSAGSLIALSLSLGLSGRDVFDQFNASGPRVFPSLGKRLWSKILRIPKHGLSSPRYGQHMIEEVLIEHFGETKLGECKIRTLIPVYSMTESKVLVLDSKNPDHQSIPAWKAARASSAAPVFFPATSLVVGEKEHVVIDGGVSINHPALTASAALRDQSSGKFSEIEVVSLGTGQAQTISDLKELQSAGFLNWGTHILHLLMGGPGDHVDYLCRRLHGSKYHRVQVTLPPDYYGLDDASRDNKRMLLGYARQANQELDQILRILNQKSV
jgi:patatin-like phospholipase/acyl hydrolase